MAQQLRGKGITLDKVLTPSDPKNRKTKVRKTLEQIHTPWATFFTPLPPPPTPLF